MDAPADPPLDEGKPLTRQRLARLTRLPRRTRLIAAGVLIGLVVVGLVVVVSGGTGARRNPEATFRAQARMICASAQRQIADLQAPTTLRELVGVAHRAARISGRTRAALAALDPPATVSADMPVLLASLRRQQRLADQLAAAAGRSSRVGVRRLIARGRREDAHTGRAAQRVGLQGCSTTTQPK